MKPVALRPSVWFALASAGLAGLSLPAAEPVATNTLSAEEQVIKDGKLELPPVWRIPRSAPPVVCIAKGLWWNFFGLDDAMIELRAKVSSAHHHGDGGVYKLESFVSNWQELERYSLVILANVDAGAVTPAQRLLLEEYVRNGGALFVFGGCFAFERGQYPGTALDRLTPFETKAHWLPPARKRVLRAAEGAKGILPDDLSWSMEPSAFQCHDVVRLRDGARVLATAGDMPALVAWQVGKGRVAAFAVTVEFNPGDNDLAFWEWGDLSRVVAAVSRWLVQEQGSGPPPPIATGGTERLLREILSLAMGGDDAKRERLLKDLLSGCRDKAGAEDLLKAMVNCDLTPNRALVMDVARAVRPFADAGFSTEANDLIGSKDAGKAALGLRVLGLSRAPNAASVIVEFLDKGTGAFAPGGKADRAGIDDLIADAHQAQLGGDDLLRLAAVMALGDLGDPGQLERLKHATDAFSVAAQSAEAAETADIRESAFQQSLVARVRLGDRSAVGGYLAQMLKNDAEIESLPGTLRQTLSAKERLKAQQRIAQRLPLLRQRQVLCTEMLGQIPVALYPDLAAELVKRNDYRTVPMAMTALAPRPGAAITAEAAEGLVPMLTDCKLLELKLLALQILREAGSPDADKILSGTLLKLARSEEAADARFALRHVGRIPPAERAAVVFAALQRKEPELRRIARCSVPLLPEKERQSIAGPPR